MNTTAGSFALVGSVPNGDSTMVVKLKAAGAIILAKANLSRTGPCFFSSILMHCAYPTQSGQTIAPPTLPPDGPLAAANALVRIGRMQTLGAQVQALEWRHQLVLQSLRLVLR